MAAASAATGSAPEVHTTGLEVLAVVALALNPILLSVAGVLFWRLIVGLQTSIEAYGKNQRECQLSLLAVYRTKAEANVDSDRQWQVLNDLGARVVRVETKLEAEDR